MNTLCQAAGITEKQLERLMRERPELQGIKVVLYPQSSVMYHCLTSRDIKRMVEELGPEPCKCCPCNGDVSDCDMCVCYCEDQ